MDALRQFLTWLEPPRRRRALAGLLALLATGAALLGFGSSGDDAAAQSDAKANAMPDPLAILAARSPGARAEGALYQTKPRRIAARNAPRVTLPHERVLSAIRTRPPGLAPPPAADGIAAIPQGFPAELMSMPGFDAPALGPAFDVPAFAFGDAPPSASGTEPFNPPGPGPAVPEPATWLLMAVGVGMIGQALRRRTLQPG